MSIYIKGMEMPKSGQIVLVEIDENGDVFAAYDGGRLIDADILGIRDEEKQAYEAYLQEKGEFYAEEPLLEYLRGRLEGLTNASGRVRFAPTIIPAEPPKEEN